MRQLGEALQTMQQRFPALSALVCGFSAGGHLAASLGVHWRELGLPRPDGMILGYPVITAGKYAHCGSIQIWPVRTIPAGLRWKRRSRPMPPPLLAYRHRPGSAGENSLLLAGTYERGRCGYEMHVYPAVHGLESATP